MPRLVAPRLVFKLSPSPGLDTIVLANVMLYTSDHEQDSASPQQSTDKVEPGLENDVTLIEPMLEGDVALIDFPDDIDHEIEQLSEADMDSFLEAYRASQDELLGRVPLPTPSATALADDTKDGDALDPESDTSGSDDDEPEPKQGILEATCRYLLLRCLRQPVDLIRQ